MYPQYPQPRQISLHLILTIFLGVGMLLFAGLAIAAYQQNSYTQNHQAQLSAQAATVAAATQKKQDDTANTKANEQPYQTYTADPEDGGFQLQIPKGWSIYSVRHLSDGTSLEVLADPNVVNVDDAGNAINTHQFKLRLVSDSLTNVNAAFSDNLKKKTLTSHATTVSGIAATWFQGAIDNQRHNGVVITLPVRDKVMVISTETTDYLSEFQAIVSSAKITP